MAKVWFTNEHYSPYVNSCVGANNGDVGLQQFLNKCFDALANACNNSDGYKGSWAAIMYRGLSEQCAAAWTKEWLNTLSADPSGRCTASWINANSGVLRPVTSNLQANADCASATEQSMINDAISARQAGINAGMGKSRSGLLGDASSTTNAISTGTNAYSSSIQNQGSTQADYLMKMGQACALCNCANNMREGALRNAIGAAFTGAGAGASLGATIGGSGGSNK